LQLFRLALGLLRVLEVDQEVVLVAHYVTTAVLELYDLLAQVGLDRKTDVASLFGYFAQRCPVLRLAFLNVPLGEAYFIAAGTPQYQHTVLFVHNYPARSLIVHRIHPFLSTGRCLAQILPPLAAAVNS
jgi:hypothetical protein